MIVVFSFVGGRMDGKTIAGNLEDTTVVSHEVAKLYYLTEGGTNGQQVRIPGESGAEVYEVSRKLDLGDSVIVRTRLVATQHSPTDTPITP